MNLTCELSTIIFKHYHTRQKLADSIGVSRASVQRWLSEDPMRFLLHATKMKEAGVDIDELLVACQNKQQSIGDV